MSFEKFYFRKSLYMIGQNMGKTDVGNLKFLCNLELPRRHMEKIQSAFELFCALEFYGKITATDSSRLRELLLSVHKEHLLGRNPLHNIGRDEVQTDRGGKLPLTPEQIKLNAFLVDISDNMANRDLRNLICFVYDLLPSSYSLADIDKVPSATPVFEALCEDRYIGPRNLNILKEIFEVIGRNDLCQRVKEYASCGHPVANEDFNPPSYVPNSLPFSSNSSSENSSSSFSSSVFSPATDAHLPSHMMGQKMSLDHGSSTMAQPTAPPHPQQNSNPLPSPQQPIGGNSVSSYNRQAIFHGGAMIHGQPPHGTTPTHPQAPPLYPHSQPQQHHNFMPPLQPLLSDPSSQSLGPYNTVPEPESMEHAQPYYQQQQLHQQQQWQQQHQQSQSFPQYQAPPVSSPVQQSESKQPVAIIRPAAAGPGSGGGPPVLVAQTEENLLLQLKEKENQLKKVDQVKDQLLSTMEFQREMMMQLMQKTDISTAPKVDKRQLIYPMNHSPHGLALIIGNEKFSHNPRRPRLELKNRRGCEVDVINFENIFSVLGYEVIRNYDVTAKDIESAFNDLAARDYSNYDSFVMCISTHGECNSFIFGSDSVSIDLYLLIRKIQSCRSLANKPKMFFIQACRLPSEDMVSSDSGGKVDVSLSNNPEADIFIAWATSRDSPAYRSPQEGSWFVTALSAVFVKQAMYNDVVTMMYEVNRIVTSAEGHDKDSNTAVQQCVETSSSLRGPVRFIL